MLNQLITTIIPVHNGEPYLREAITSVPDQKYNPHEILVMDDGSSDSSAAIAVSYPAVKVISRPHSGVAPTLNAGLDHASGSLIAFLDADDRWLPGKLIRQMQFMIGNSAIEMVFGQVRQFENTIDGEIFGELQSGVSKITMLARRSAFERAGMFSVKPGVHDFLEWYARAKAVGLESVVLTEVLAERRVHAANDGVINHEKRQQTYLLTLRQVLADRRKMPGLPTDDK